MNLDRLPAVLLRLEGAAVLGGSIALYADGGWSWLAFALLFLAPDMSMLAYIGGPRAGMLAYDVVHFAGGPVALGTVGVIAGADVAVQVALIWFAHIGIDRLLGYGLKYPTAFRDTHLQRV
jgi:Domain of unknown function (DUF4260)